MTLCLFTTTFPGLAMTFAIFHDFPGLANCRPKFHDFPGLSRTSGHPAYNYRKASSKPINLWTCSSFASGWLLCITLLLAAVLYVSRIARLARPSVCPSVRPSARLSVLPVPRAPNSETKRLRKIEVGVNWWQKQFCTVFLRHSVVHGYETKGLTWLTVGRQSRILKMSWALPWASLGTWTQSASISIWYRELVHSGSGSSRR